MNIRFFAWMRTKAGVSEQTINPPADVTTVQGLIDWLCAQSDGYGDAFAEMSVVRVAVNQEHVALDHPVAADDEVAFFPPVTGG